MRRPVFGAFTLLEVMVAVAILGLSLVAIFGSEAGAIRAGARARHMTVASLLARCKMAEVEEHMARDGLPAVSEDGDDECCEGGEHPGFSCHWRVEQVLLPDAIDIGADDPLAAAGAIGADHAGDSAGAGDLENALTGAAGGDAIGAFAVQYAFPILRPMIEEQVRRATVSVRWAEGASGASASGPCEESERNCFEVVQFLVGAPGEATTDDDAAPPPPPGGI